MPEQLRIVFRELRRRIKRMARICLDYGHGGSDPGAVYKGRKEADDNHFWGKQ